jgi:hypothetical protein
VPLPDASLGVLGALWGCLSRSTCAIVSIISISDSRLVARFLRDEPVNEYLNGRAISASVPRFQTNPKCKRALRFRCVIVMAQLRGGSPAGR